MKLWLIAQSDQTGYDTFDSAVVIAPDEETARNIHPRLIWGNANLWDPLGDWAAPENVTAKYLGEAAPGSEQQVVCASYNAG